MDCFNIINDTDYDIAEFEKDFNNIFVAVKKRLQITDILELNLVFVTPDKQKELNKKYRKKDYIADVLTFALEQDNDFNINNVIGFRLLGDIYICIEKAIAQANDYEHTLRRELAFLFTHGFLHILGYDHQTPNEEEVMFSLQEEILNSLQITRK